MVFGVDCKDNKWLVLMTHFKYPTSRQLDFHHIFSYEMKIWNGKEKKKNFHAQLKQ